MGKLVLVVDDEPGVRDALRDVLEESQYRVTVAANGREALEKMDTLSPDVVLMDIRMPELDGIKVLEIVRARGSQVPIILITAYGSTETTITAMRLGAFDYIVKPIRLDELLTAIERATEIREPVIKISSRIGTGAPPGTLIGTSRAMQEVYKAIGRIAEADVTVLIQGESGTGKELVAEAIHYHSLRKGKPLVKINCTSIPENLLESELFGYEKGAFTGAVSRKPGKFELAAGGTVFLDEIGEMSPAMQVKLLRVLQEKAFERIGGTETIRVDARIIAATNKDLELSVREGHFREDLFYRLNVVQITLPPLRERRSDIPLLADYFISLSRRTCRKKINGITRPAMEMLLAHDWPGNVRELKNVCERAVLMARGPVITANDVQACLRNQRLAGHSTAREIVPAPPGITEIPLKKIVADVERYAIVQALKEHNGNRSAAARALHLNRSSLYAKMRELGLDKEIKGK
ncbi:MAG: sigma-54 dependent transcriptional regulator [Bacillota bacterium]